MSITGTDGQNTAEKQPVTAKSRRTINSTPTATAPSTRRWIQQVEQGNRKDIQDECMMMSIRKMYVHVGVHVLQKSTAQIKGQILKSCSSCLKNTGASSRISDLVVETNILYEECTLPC